LARFSEFPDARRVKSNVQEYKNSFQFRSAGHCRRDSRCVAAVRKKNQRLQQTVEANEASFMAAVDEIAGISARLLGALETNAPSRNREEEAAKAKARGAERFGT